MRPRSSVMTRAHLMVVVATAFVAAACSGAVPDGAEPSVTTGVASGSTTEAPSASQPDPDDSLAPPGVVWMTHELDPPIENASVLQLTAVGEELWLLGREGGAPVIRRSTDGIDWRRIDLAPEPGGSQSYSLAAPFERPDGGYIVVGTHQYTCTPPYLCLDSRGVVFLSDDGEQWRMIQPAEWSPGGGRKVVVRGLVWHAEQYVALVTFADADWSTYLYSSQDGESWHRVTRLEAHGDLLSGDSLYSDGTNLVVQGAAHLCPNPNPRTPQGWVLGATWTSHIRLWQGTGPDDLRLLTLDDLPFAPDRIDADCEENLPSSWYNQPHPTAAGDVIGGVITLYDTTHVQQSDVFDGSRTIARLEGESWTVERIEPGGTRPNQSRIVEIGSGYGFVERIRHPIGSTTNLMTFQVVLRDGDAWTVREGASPLIQGGLRGVSLIGDRIVVAGNQGLGSPTVTVWTSEEADPSTIGTCDIGPGARCLAVDVATMLGEDGYDLSGLDLSGIDLRHARLDGIVFDGADLSGALLTYAQARGASFAGADLSGANLVWAELDDLAGAILVDANLERAKLGIGGPLGPVEGSSWMYTELTIGLADSVLTEAIELALTGADLGWSRIQRGSSDHPPPVITDLRGSIVAWSRMFGLDLSQANIAGVDFTDVGVSEDTLCPAGLTYQVVPLSSTSTREVCR